MKAGFAAVASLVFLLTLSGAQPQKKGFLYQPSGGAFWDPSVIYHADKYYLFAMYGGDSIWLATSDDGVHWKDYGVVLKSQGSGAIGYGSRLPMTAATTTRFGFMNRQT
jgi:hypothetical protein